MIKIIQISCITLLLTGCYQDKDSTRPISEVNLDAPAYFGSFEIPIDNPITEEGVALGRKLFYDPILSRDSSLSCASCHQQEKAFTDGLPLAQGLNGFASRSTPAIINMLWNDHFFWDGRAESIEEQAVGPIENFVEMNMTLEEVVERILNNESYVFQFRQAFGDNIINGERVVQAIAQFERILISSNSKYDKFLRGEITLSDEEQRGMQLFFTHPEPSINLRGANCGDCHGNALTRLKTFENIGLDTIFTDVGRENVTGNPNNRGAFKVPTLRNIELTGPYMHDGRFTTLEEVLDFYNDTIHYTPSLSNLVQNVSNESGANTLKLTAQEKSDVISFLKTLTDSTFVNDERFSNPFE